MEKKNKKGERDRQLVAGVRLRQSNAQTESGYNFKKIIKRRSTV